MPKPHFLEWQRQLHYKIQKNTTFSPKQTKSGNGM